MSDWIERAKAYVDASNHHDLPRIKAMLAETCEYVSDGVGRHDGVNAICKMMESFFSLNADVHWQVDRYQLFSDCVLFEFIITLAGKRSDGLERLFFQTDGKISRIEVRR